MSQTFSIPAAVAAILAAGSMHAATVQAAESEGPASEELAEVRVTGSRIVRKDYVANSPIVTVETKLFTDTGTVGIETVLNQLPQFVPAATQFSSTTLQATATTTPGASVVNLRGLGSFRTLTLIDGKRATPLNATLAVDTNSIPSSAIERVEIISGGASAVYGADAVAGVVNFILKDKFQGLNVSARYGVTEEGDGEELEISTLLGTSFSDGRGNILLGAEYADRSKAYNINRYWLRKNLSNPYIAGTEGLVPETYVDFSSLPAGQRPTQAAINAIFTNVPTCVLPNGTGNACPGITPAGKFFVNRSANGTGTLFTGASAFLGTTGNAGTYRYTGPFEDPAYPGLPFRKLTADQVLHENNLNALTTVPLQRISMFGKAEYEFTEDVKAYVRGNFSHNETQTATAYSPAVNNWTGTIPVGFDRTGSGTVYAPSLVTGTNNTKREYQAGGAFGLNCPATGGCTESEAFPLPPELAALLSSRTGTTVVNGQTIQNRNMDIKVHRVMDWLPERQTLNRTTTTALNAGLEGRLANNWSWDAAVGYGITEGVTIGKGFADLAQYVAVLTSPNYGVNFTGLGISPTSSGLGKCTSGLPIFRDFQVSQDCIDTISVDTQATSQISQKTVDMNLAGSLFELPAGDLQFALGADWRKWDFEFLNDRLNSSSTFVTQVVGVFAQANTRAALSTREAYGELLVPIVHDLPLVESLNLELGGRISDYSTSGKVSTYKILGDWSVNQWVRFRGGFNRATRAPHLVEQFQGKSITTTNVFDPCSKNQQNALARGYSANSTYNTNAAQVEALCRTLMGTAAADVFYSVPLASQTSQTFAATSFSSGNPNVKPETAKTYTAGMVLRSPFQNAWASGLSATIDYYSIGIRGLIALQSIDTAWRQCILSNDAASAACAVVGRDPFDGRPSLANLQYINRGKLKFTGIDAAFTWRARLNELGLESVPGNVAINTQITRPLERKIQDGDSTAPIYDYIYTAGCSAGVTCSGYKFQAFTTFTYNAGPGSVSLRWNHYPPIKSANVATDPTSKVRGVFQHYNLLSLSGSYEVSSKLTLRAGVDNLFNVDPPLAGGSYAADGSFASATAPQLPTPPTQSGDARYDQLGRRYFVGIDLKL